MKKQTKKTIYKNQPMSPYSFTGYFLAFLFFNRIPINNKIASNLINLVKNYINENIKKLIEKGLYHTKDFDNEIPENSLEPPQKKKKVYFSI